MRFIETLLITDKIENINLHNERMNKTRYDFFRSDPLDLRDFVQTVPQRRVRVTYSEKIEKVEYFPLKKRSFKKFKLVYSDIDYSYKYADRKKLESLKPEGFDEVIIVKNSLVTDTTISNLAFFDGERWLTPKTPLLMGTKRKELLIKNFLTPEEIKPEVLDSFSKIAMINAVLGFFVIEDFDIIV